jgi:hypothetical protein
VASPAKPGDLGILGDLGDYKPKTEIFFSLFKTATTTKRIFIYLFIFCVRVRFCVRTDAARLRGQQIASTGGRGGHGRREEGSGETSVSARTHPSVRANGFLPARTVKSVRGVNADVRTVNFTVGRPF